MKSLVNSSVIIITLLSILFTTILPITYTAQNENDDIVIGKTITINSKVLNEQRNIFIYTPVGYDQSEDKYPVIYVLDGQGNFFFSVGVANFLARSQRMPRSIIVGIPNTDRTRDFTPVHAEEWATSGGADNFLAFMEKELIPYIEDNYRTHTYKTLFGHSLCGMFSIYTLFEKPDMFNSFIAVSPYLQFDNQVVLDKVETILSERTDFKKDLFVTIGDEPDYTASLERMQKLFSEKTKNLRWKLSERKTENHTSILLKSFYDGLEFIYSDWTVKDESIESGFDAVKKHYLSLSNKYGYDVKPNEFAINAIGYRYLGNDDYENATEAFEYNVKLNPNSANVYDSLGETFEKTGNIEAAIVNYTMAVHNGEILKDRNLNIFKKNLNRVSESK